MINKNYLHIYLALLRRDLLVIRQRLRSAFADSGVQLIMNVLLYGALFPAMGVSTALIAPLFISSQAVSIWFLGMGFGIRMLFDITFNRFIDYRLTLPLPKRWLFASSITYFVIEGIIISAPLLTFGIIMLGNNFKMIEPQWFLFLVTYLLALIMFGTLFLGLSLYYQFHWFMDNLWPRRLTILYSLSPIFVVWNQVQSFSPFFSKIMLCSPITYACEGLRSTIIGGSEYISPYICIGMMLIFITLFIWFTSAGIAKRLDPV